MSSDTTSEPLLTHGGSVSQAGKNDNFNIYMLSFSFFVLFTAYNTLQNYATSLLGAHLGDTSLGILYVCIALTVFVAPNVVRRVGERRTLVLGAASYVLYCASLIHVYKGVVLAASVIIGLGTGLLWIAMSSFLMKCTTDADLGRVTGIFWAIYQMCNVVGNLGIFFVFRKYNSTQTLFIIFTCVALVGTVMMSLLRPVDQSRLRARLGAGAVVVDTVPEALKAEPTGAGSAALVPVATATAAVATTPVPEPPHADQTVWQHVVGSIKKMGDPVILMLSPMFLFSGMELAFWTGEFPQLLNAKSLGLVLCFAGIGEVLGGTVLGRLSDVIGRSPTLLLGSLLFYVALITTVLLRNQPGASPAWEKEPWFAYIAALCFGLADCIFNTQSFAILGQLFPDELGESPADDDDACGASATAVSADGQAATTKPAAESDGASGSGESFTAYLFLQNVGSAIGYFGAIPLPLVHRKGYSGSLTQVWVLGALLLVSTLLFVVADPACSCQRKASQRPPSVNRV